MGKSNQVWKGIWDRAGSYGGLIIVPLPVSIKDRSLTALLSCWTHAPHLAGRISRSDREAWTLSGPGIEPPCAVLVMVEENDEGAARNLGIPWIPRSPERSSGTGGACRTRELVLDSVIRWSVAHLISECGLCGEYLASWLEIDSNRHRSWIVSTWHEPCPRSKDYGTLGL